MTAHRVVPAWARDFNNQRRHCWENRDGTLTVDVWAKKVSDDLDAPMTCDGNHDPKLIGQVEWLRFVREFGPVAASFPHDNPFAPREDETRYALLNEVDGHRTSDGRHTYSETYLRRSVNDWGVKPVFRVFLDNEAGWARIECYDEGYVGSCELTLAAVEASYRKEVTA